MKKAALFCIFALLFAGASCDTTSTTTISISTGSVTRADNPPSGSGVAYVAIAAYKESISPDNLVGMTIAPVGSVAQLVVPTGINLEIFAAALTADRVMAPYYGIGYYYQDYEPEPGAPPANQVTIYMENKLFEFPPLESPQGAECIEEPSSRFRVNWVIYYDPGSAPNGFDGETDKYLETDLFRMLISRGIGTADNMQYIGFTHPSEEYYDDEQPFLVDRPSPSLMYYYTVQLAIPSLGIESAAPDAVGVYAPALP